MTVSGPNLTDILQTLVASQLIERESAESYSFHHALTREAAYTTLLKGERKRLHRVIAETLRRELGEQREMHGMHLGDLAHHFYEAEAWDEALSYAEQAGMRALSAHALREAITYFTHALEAAQQLGQPPPARFLHARGKAYETVGDFARACPDYEQSLAVAQAAGNAHAEWQALIDLGFLWAERDYRQTGAYFRRSADVACDLPEPAYRAHSQNWIGNWYSNIGQAVESLQAHREALAIFESSNDRAGMAETLDLLCYAYSMAGDMAASVESASRAIAIFRERGDLQGLSSTLAMRCTMSGPALSDTVPAALATQAEIERDYGEAEQLSRQIGRVAGVVFAGLVVCQQWAYLGELGKVLALSPEVARLAEEINHPQWISGMHYVRGRNAFALMDYDSAEGELSQGLTQALKLGSALWIGFNGAYLALTHAARGDFARAEQTIRTGYTPEHVPINLSERLQQMAWGRILLARGEPAAALDVVDELLASTPGSPALRAQPIPQLLLLRGEALTVLGRAEEADHALSEALRGARLREIRPALWEIHCARGRLHAGLRHHAEVAREFAAARQIIEGLAEGIADTAERERFRAAALATLK